jgi:hypothetical protein
VNNYFVEWGLVIRDSHGDVRGAGAGRMEAMGGATHVEAEACN